MPADYPNHGDGLIFVGLEQDGFVYAYSLNHITASFQRIATFFSGLHSIMALSFDTATGYLWCVCDNHCDGVNTVISIYSKSKFTQIAAFDRAASMGNFNTEGVTISPDAMCIDGFKDMIWADDSHHDGHAIRHDKIPCTSFINTDSGDSNDDDWAKHHAVALIFAIVGGLIVLTGLAVITKSFFSDQNTEGVPLEGWRDDDLEMVDNPRKSSAK
jgi:hypothetical protein